MHMKHKVLFVAIGLLPFLGFGQGSNGFKGQAPIKEVPTVSRPVQKQQRQVFDPAAGTVFFSNDFQGARLNGVTKVTDTLFNVLISPENTPVNGSAWYAFKVWATSTREITLSFQYSSGRHRYNAKLSKDGRTWQEAGNATGQQQERSAPYVLKLKVGPDTTWVAAQELVTSSHVAAWIQKLGENKLIKPVSIGKSTEGRTIPGFTVGNTSARQVVLVTGRNHPPEVTGHFALQAFVETICGNSEQAKEFRRRYLVYVVPLLNPDGVDEGHWRHNAGGVDLNRDWAAFNQPEPKALRDFLVTHINGTKELLFGIDFHSTHDDIYYTVDPKLKSRMPGFVPRWLDGLKDVVPGYVPNVKPLYFEPPTFTLFSYLFETFGTEALVYEIGDNTPKDFIVKKGKASAQEFMRLMLAHAKQ